MLTGIQGEVSWAVPTAFLFSAGVFYWLGVLFRRSPYVTLIGKELVVRERLFQERRFPLLKAKASANASRLRLESHNGEAINIRSALLSADDYCSLKETVSKETSALA